MTDLECIETPPLALNRFRLRREGNMPVGFATWAYVNERVEQLLNAGIIRMSLADWKCGPKPMVVDMLFQRRFLRQIIAEYIHKLFRVKNRLGQLKSVSIDSRIPRLHKSVSRDTVRPGETRMFPGHAFYTPDKTFEKIGDISLNDTFVFHETRGIMRAGKNGEVGEEGWKLCALGVKKAAQSEACAAWSAARKAA